MEYAEYAHLKDRVQNLKQQYLPPVTIRPLTRGQEDDIRALRVLVHAEIEDFLEALCELLAVELGNKCKSQPNTIYRIWGETISSKCISIKNDNNGVKEKNIRNMFGPLGFGDSEFDKISSIFLSRMDTLGKDRGLVAHRSYIRATQGFNPKREDLFINEIMGYLYDFCKAVYWRRLLGFYN